MAAEAPFERWWAWAVVVVSALGIALAFLYAGR